MSIGAEDVNIAFPVNIQSRKKEDRTHNKPKNKTFNSFLHALRKKILNERVKVKSMDL